MTRESEQPPREYDSAHPVVQDLLHTSAAELSARRAELQAAANAAGLTAEQIEQVLDSHPDLPRPLLPEERATLMALLAHADFDGRAALLTQAETAQVVGYCGCGCASVFLDVDHATPPAPQAPSPIPNEADVLDSAGEPIGGVIVFLEAGYLDFLEIYYYIEPINPFPPLDRLLLRGPQ